MITIGIYLLFLVHVCKAPSPLGYNEPTNCSSNQFYQTANLSCVDCTSGQVTGDDGALFYLAYGAHLLECVMLSRLPLRMLRRIRIDQLSDRGHDHLYVMSNWQCKNNFTVANYVLN